MRNILNKITHGLLYQGWNKWYDLHRAKIRSGRLMQRALNRIVEGPTKYAWNKWLDVVDHQKWAGQVMDSCLARITNVSMSMGMRNWQDYVMSIKELKTQRHIHMLANAHTKVLMKGILKRWTAQMMSRAFRQWLGIHRAKYRSGKLIQRTFDHWSEGTMLWGWMRWLDRMNGDEQAKKSIRIMQATVKRWILRVVSRAFRQWLGVHCAKIRSSRLLQRTFARWTDETVLGGWMR